MLMKFKCKTQGKTQGKTKLMERRIRQNGIAYVYSLFRDRDGYSVQVIDLAGGRYVKCVLVDFTSDPVRAEDFFRLLVTHCVSAAHLTDVYEDEFP